MELFFFFFFLRSQCFLKRRVFEDLIHVAAALASHCQMIFTDTEFLLLLYIWLSKWRAEPDTKGCSGFVLLVCFHSWVWGFGVFFLTTFIYLIYIYSFGDNQVTTENVKSTIFYKISLNFYSLLETCKRLKSLWFIELNAFSWMLFPVNTTIKIDNGATSVAITCFIKLHWLHCSWS